MVCVSQFWVLYDVNQSGEVERVVRHKVTSRAVLVHCACLTVAAGGCCARSGDEDVNLAHWHTGPAKRGEQRGARDFIPDG